MAARPFVIAVLALCAACENDDKSSPPPPSEPPYVTFTLDGRFRRVSAEGGKVQNLRDELDRISDGDDVSVNVSPDGEWLVVESERFGCTGDPCYAVITRTVTSGSVVTGAKGPLRGGRPALGPGALSVVYPAPGGPHALDLWFAETGAPDTAPILLTADSPFQFNDLPALSADGARVVFDCGDGPFGGPGTSICEVSTQGLEFRIVFAPADGPTGTLANALHHADYAPDGSIVFEADWSGDHVWRLPGGAGTPEVIGSFAADNSPCVLADGRIVSLWLGRPENTDGFHELKIMDADGANERMLLLNEPGESSVDITDAGLGCGG